MSQAHSLERFFFLWRFGPWPPLVQASQSHSNTPHSVEFLWTSDQPDAETSYLSAHNIHERQTFITPAGFEPTIPASERPQTHGLDRAATAHYV